MNFNGVLRGIPSPLVPRLKDQREFSSMVSLSLSCLLARSCSPSSPLFFPSTSPLHFWTPFFQSFPPSSRAFVSLLIPPCVSRTFLLVSLSTRPPCEICIRATRGVIIAKPSLSSLARRTTHDSQHTKKTRYSRTKCCDELLKIGHNELTKCLDSFLHAQREIIQQKAHFLSAPEPFKEFCTYTFIIQTPHLHVRTTARSDQATRGWRRETMWTTSERGDAKPKAKPVAKKKKNLEWRLWSVRKLEWESWWRSLVIITNAWGLMAAI